MQKADTLFHNTDTKPSLINPLLKSYDWYKDYKRGLSYTNDKKWDEAEKEFKMAISKRPKDQWRVMSHGVSVLARYFPHRELGIVYLNQGRINAALSELTTSIRMTKSAKTQYYLDQAREKFLKMNDMDHESPQITITNKNKHDTIIYTNQSHFQLTGIAEDNYFISSLEINHKPLFIPFSAPNIPIQVKMDLDPGLNILSLSAQDLIENKSEKNAYVMLDQIGPFVVINNEDHARERGVLRVWGIVYDHGGISAFSCGNEEVLLLPDELYKEFDFLLKKEDHIFFSATDRAGNITEGDIFVNNMNSAIQVVDNRKRVGSRHLLSDSNSGPFIYLFEHAATVFQPRIVIRGVIRSEEKLSNISINSTRLNLFNQNKGLETLLKRVWHGHGTQCYFTKIVEELHEGMNEIVIHVEDRRGQISEKRITIDYKKREIEKIERRWSMGILPFTLNEGPEHLFTYPRPHLLNQCQDILYYVFFHTERFNILERERVEVIMHELDLQSSALVDNTTGPAIGNLLAAEVVLPGSINEFWDRGDRCLHIIARLIDVESGAMLTIKDVYGTWQSFKDTEYLLQGLAQLFMEEFPLLQGSVIEKHENAITINLGEKDLLKKDMRVIFGQNLNRNKEDISILGEGKVLSVDVFSSLARVDNKDIWNLVQVGDIVMTK
ncbi:MAG: CsgG/HfaB family protein [bacterium]